jgi:hypothetical protein
MILDDPNHRINPIHSFELVVHALLLHMKTHLALFTGSNLEELRMDPTEGCSKPPDDCHVGDI